MQQSIIYNTIIFVQVCIVNSNINILKSSVIYKEHIFLQKSVRGQLAFKQKTSTQLIRRVHNLDLWIFYVITHLNSS